MPRQAFLFSKSFHSDILFYNWMWLLLRYITNGKEKKNVFALYCMCIYYWQIKKCVSVIVIYFFAQWFCVAGILVWGLVCIQWLALVEWLYQWDGCEDKTMLEKELGYLLKLPRRHHLGIYAAQKSNQITNDFTGAVIQQKSTYHSVHTKTNLSPFYNSQDVSWFQTHAIWNCVLSCVHWVGGFDSIYTLVLD